MTRPRTILLPTDFSECARRAQQYALDLAQAQEAILHIVHVVDPPVLATAAQQEKWWIEERARAGAEMERLWEATSSTDLQVVRTVQRIGPGNDTAADLLAYAEDSQADLIVMGTHGRRGLPRLLLGSVAETVMRQAPCPTLVVRADCPGTTTVEHIVVPLDLSEQSLQAWSYAQELAALYGARLTLLHVSESEPPRSTMETEAYVSRLGSEVAAWTRDEAQHLVRMAQQDGLSVRCCLTSGDPVDIICKQAQEADLVVMTSHGRSGLDRLLLGSVAETVVRQAPCPVLVVRPTSRTEEGTSAAAGEPPTT